MVSNLLQIEFVGHTLKCPHVINIWIWIYFSTFIHWQLLNEMSADMSVLGNLCRSLFLGAARIFKMVIFLVTTLISILSVYYLNKSGCRFVPPTRPVIASPILSGNSTQNPEIQKHDEYPVFGRFDHTLCLILNIYHAGLIIPISVVMFVYLTAGMFCFKHHKNTIEGYIENHRREFVFLFLTTTISIISFSVSCVFEVVIAPCLPCKDPATQNVYAKNMSLVRTMTWFATFMWTGLGGVGVTTFCIFHELVKNKSSGID